MSFVQDKIYPSMPVFVQNLMISAFGFQWQQSKFGGCYADFLKEVKSREFNTSEQWHEYQTHELRKLLVHAYGHVEFYRGKYKAAGFTEKDLCNISSF